MNNSKAYKSNGVHQGGKVTYHDDLKKFQAQKWANDIKKKEQETKRFKKAATLRKYAKLCKAEGIQSDRVRIGDRKEKSDTDSAEHQKRPKDSYRPFKKAEKEAVRLEQAKQEKDMQAQQRLKDKEDAIKKREEKRKVLSKTTKKGQPILGNHIKSILSKLQNA